jgi:eukaryotic-like serine/threonine-protein kinase
LAIGFILGNSGSMSAAYKKIGKYDVLNVIGRGGMGVIYKGVDPGIGRIVAIKMITGAFADDPELLHRFYREAQSVGKLQHPNIVTIYDLGVEDGSPYLVMEFLEGESLDALIRTRRAMSLEEKLDIVVQVCEGVGYAHKRNIVHRDIKPANVMLLQDGRVKIFDFGIARIGERMTLPGQIMGSFQYMSPEQIDGGNVDDRSDIFSIGVLLYELLTTKLPFEGKGPGETLLKIIHDAPPPLNRFLTGYPADLDEIMQRVLAKDREQRFQAAEDLAFELAHVHEKLRRERLNEYLAAAEAARAAGQLSRAKEQLLQLLKIDRQNVRANDMLRELQEEIQRQQRGEQARELQSEAEKAVTRGELAEALVFLDRAVELDKTNSEIVRLRDLVRENKARSDRVRELLQRAEMARETGDLDEARRAVEEAVVIDGKSTEVRALQAAISREIAERHKQLKLQKYIGDARKQISARRFTGALELLKEAELIDSAFPGLQELTSLALSGQQQEKRRRDLERLTIEIEDALNRSDYDKACAKAVEGLSSYPDDRGLKKLKALAEKELAAREKRRYVEETISLAQKLVKEGKPDAALVTLQEALEKYPAELGLQSMLALVRENVERERIEQKKSECIQKARQAIRRRDFGEAISLLQATRQELQSSDFDDLLQSAQDEAASHAKRQRVDSVAEQAHRLNSEEKYEEAIQLLKATLQEIPDQELEIILSDSRRNVEEFNRNVQEAISNAKRLMHQSHYIEAVKFLEARPYGKAEQFRSALAEAREKRQFWQALCLAKEEIRAAIFRSDLDEAQALWQKSLEQFGDVTDVRLLAAEIRFRRRGVANARLDAALRDARVLLLVRSFDLAVRVLETTAPVAADADPQLNEQFQLLLDAARSRLASKRQDSQRRESSNKEQVRDSEPQPTQSQLVWPACELRKELDLDDETQAPDTGDLRAILGEVTQIADHYRGDTKLQTSIDALKQKITSRISALREAKLAQAPCSAFPNSQEPVELGTTSAAKHLADSSQRGLEPAVQMESSDVVSPISETTTSVVTPPFGIGGVAPSLSGPQAEEVGDAHLEQATPRYLPSSVPTANSDIAELEPQAPTQSFADGGAAETELVNPPGTDDELAIVRAAPEVVPQSAVADPFSLAEAPGTCELPVPPHPASPRPRLVNARLWRNPTVVAACLMAVGLVIGISVYRSKSNGPRVPIPQQRQPEQTQPDPIAIRQQAAINAADKLVAADDLAGAQHLLRAVTGLQGPLDATVQERLAGISAATKDESVRRLRRNEEQWWQDAVEQVDNGKFDLAKSDLRKILNLGDGGQRKAEAQRYLNQVVPAREKEEHLFALAQRASQGTGSDDLQRAGDFLNQVIALSGRRKPEAETLRDTVNTKIQEILKQQRQRQIDILNAEIDTRLRSGDFAGARQQLDKIKQLGGDVTSASGKIDEEQKKRQAQIDAEAVFQKAVQRYQRAVGSNNRSELESAREDLENIAKAGGPHATEAAKDANQITQQLAELDTRSVPPPLEPSRVPLPSAADLQEVRSVIQRYIDAFEHKDADALQQVWPTLGDRYSKYKKSFASASSIRMKLETEQIDIAAGGATAVATTMIAQDYTPKGQRAQSIRNRTVFQLSKSNGTWRIHDVQ